jgi:hypothetical protein
MRALIPFTLLLAVLAGIIYAARALAMALIASSAERGTVIPASFSLARVPVPAGEPLLLSVPARLSTAAWYAVGTFALTGTRVRFVKGGAVRDDIPYTAIAHLTVRGRTLTVDRRDGPPLTLRVANGASLARVVRAAATRAMASRPTAPNSAHPARPHR